jgi:hypothetical protein
MKIKLLLLSTAISFIALGCNNAKDCNSKREIVKTKGNIELHQIVDECNGNLVVREREYLRVSRDSIIPNGYQKDYYPNGKLKILAFWRLGVQDSICISYAEKGNKLSESYMSDGIFVGPQREYYNDGKIKSIVYHKNDSIKWFGIEFDPQSRITKLHGKSLRIVTEPGNENKKNGERFISLFIVPLLNNVKTELTVTMMQGEKSVYDTTVTSFTHGRANFDCYPYFFDFKKTGRYEVIGSIRLSSVDDGKLIVEDSTHLPITVK